MKVSVSSDPDVLRAAGFPQLGRRFVLWTVLPPRKQGGKPVKAPVSVDGFPVDGSDERRWLKFDTAVRLANSHRLGLGVALGWGFGGLDLDHCLDPAGRMTDLASTILSYFQTYVEVSPSGTGVKAYFLADPTFTTTAKRDDKCVELYAGRRFFALTGRRFPGSPTTIADCTKAARKLVGVLRPPPLPPPARAPGVASSCAIRRIVDCAPVRETPSIHGGSVYSLSICPFTGEEHPGGGPYAIEFPDGGIHFRCDRSSHGPLRE